TIMGHPKVLEAAVIAVPHPQWVERPLACVVPKPEFKDDLTEGEILDYLKPLVAKWWLPDEVRFIEAVPKTSVGKFDKKVLRGLCKDRNPKAQLPVRATSAPAEWRAPPPGAIIGLRDLSRVDNTHPPSALDGRNQEMEARLRERYQGFPRQDSLSLP